MSREGWTCPVCGRGVSPDEKTCEHGQRPAWTLDPTRDLPPVTEDWFTVKPPKIGFGSFSAPPESKHWYLWNGAAQ